MTMTSVEQSARPANANSATLARFQTRRPHARRPIAASRAPRLNRGRPIITENLLDDIHYCAEWAEQNYVPVRDPHGQILFLLTREKVWQHISKAVAVLTANGVATSMIWLIDDLISLANFELIAQYGDYDFIRTIVQIAGDWVLASTEVLANLEEVVRKNIYF